MSSFSVSRDAMREGAVTEAQQKGQEQQIKRRLLERLHWIAEDLLREEEGGTDCQTMTQENDGM